MDTPSYLRSHIHRHVVHRILASFEGASDHAYERGRFEDDAVQAFAHTLLRQSDGTASAAAAGVNAPDAALLKLIPLAARRLGSIWEEDHCSFFDVSLAMTSLCGLVHQITARGSGGDCELSIGRSILLTPTANNQHMLGLLLVEAAFRRSGWTVLSLRATDGILDALRSTWFAAVGLSIACGCDADKISDLIAAFRSASLNRAIVVLVGGPYFTSDPEAAVRLGADAMADDAQLAVETCGQLVHARAQEQRH